MNDAADHFDHAKGLSQAKVAEPRKENPHIVDVSGLVSTLSRYAGHAFAWVSKNKLKLKPIAMLAALSLFCVGLFLSLRFSPDILGRIEIGPLLVILLITLPVGLMINAADFQVMAHLSGVTVKFRSAVEIVLYSRAASLLPIPGSFAVRMTVLKAKGATFKRSGGLMFLFTAIWGGIGFCFSAAWLTFQAPLFLTVAFATIGLALLSACYWFVHRTKMELHSVLTAAVLRFALIALEAITLMMAVRAIGVDAQYHQTAILVVAPFLAGIVPAGFGVRETLIALLAPIAGIDPATGFLAGVAARVSGMAFLATCSIVGFFFRRFLR